MYKIENQLKFEDLIFPYGKLNENNRWIKLSIGLKEFQERAPFSASVLVDFRKRFSAKFLAEINELIIESENKKDDDNNNSDSSNKGTIIIDATCTPADIAFPQDLNLLNKSRENLEKIIDNLFDNHKHSVANRIVNLNQPHVRPIVRGKASAKTEFDAKVEISVVDGYVRVEKLSWDAYNECDNLIGIVENFKARNGKYPERVLFRESEYNIW